MTPEETARSIVATLQRAVDARDPEAMHACFDRDAVLVGSAKYNAGDDEVREYLRLVAESNSSLRWHLERYDVFLHADDLLGFGAEGQVEWRDANGEGRDPFRLTLVAARELDGWRIRHFHGSLPDA